MLKLLWKASEMRIRIRTRIANRTPELVFQNHTRALFLQLAPPFPRLELLQFDGCHTGNNVGIRMNFGLLKTEWWSTITQEIHTPDLAQFTDEGTKLPFFLSYWKHQHIMAKEGNDVMMTDYVEFRSSNAFSTLLMYPAIYMMLFYRKPIYKKKL